MLESLERQCGCGDTVTVVWQGHAPVIPSGTRAVLLRSSPPNLPLARNRGYVTGRAPVVLFLDDDVQPMEGLLDAHRKAYADTSVGAVAGSIEDPLFPADVREPSTFDQCTGSCIQNFSLQSSGFAISMMGANMSLRRDALVEIGGFDPHYKRNALWEDIDCAFRLRAHGYRVWYCSTARVVHQRLPDGGCRSDKNIRYVYHQFANTAYFACRFAPRNKVGSWVRFWKYRLEYISRNGLQKTNNTWPHDPRVVAAGIAGAVAGIIRYAVSHSGAEARLLGTFREQGSITVP
jgi:GT2 family glycosyltransferase